jgi:hypothetical protein
MYIGMVLCVLIVFSLCRESLKLILLNEPLLEGVLSHHCNVPSEQITDVRGNGNYPLRSMMAQLDYLMEALF